VVFHWPLAPLQVKCPSGNQCMRPFSLCNGVKDCTDGSDEDPAYCAASSCTDQSQVRHRGHPLGYCTSTA